MLGGHFEAGEHEYNWEAGRYMDDEGNKHDEFDLDSFESVDWMVVHITNEDGDTEYRTVYGPFDGIEELEDVIEYYFGPDYEG